MFDPIDSGGAAVKLFSIIQIQSKVAVRAEIRDPINYSLSILHYKSSPLPAACAALYWLECVYSASPYLIHYVRGSCKYFTKFQHKTFENIRWPRSLSKYN